MKHFLILLFLFPAFAGFAQPLDIRIDGGFCLNPYASFKSPDLYASSKQGINGYSFSVKTSVNDTRHWNSGIYLGFDQVRYDQHVFNSFVYGDPNGFFPRTTYAGPAISLGLYFDYKINLSKKPSRNYLYFGIESGPAGTVNNFTEKQGFDAKLTGWVFPNGYGIMAGSHAGFNCAVSRNWSFNTSISARYYDIFSPNNGQGTAIQKWNCVTVPINIGFRYQLSKNTKKHPVYRRP